MWISQLEIQNIVLVVATGAQNPNSRCRNFKIKETFIDLRFILF
jgi:hypothetical protein